ncbi:hypothetical protein FHS96_003565 [Sphingomonas zeicaulis]|uniref:subtilisin-like serine protease QhpE n=1 Tax=Sphingomonas zeicaulis TaxID=1632740 RepID=UPI003D246D82
MSGIDFTGATGRGVRITVIDSGVHPAHPHIDAARLRGGVAITREGMIEDDPQATIDRLGHGTAVSAAIQQGAPDADLLTVRVFREALRSSGTALVAAIDWAIEARADIINLSLGSPNPAHRDAFARAAARADDAGILLVSAHAVDGMACWPGALPTVLGVAFDRACPVGTYHAIEGEGGTVFSTAGVPRSIDGVPAELNLQGVSFAVARMSGFAALACEQMRDRGITPQRLREALIRAAA